MPHTDEKNFKSFQGDAYEQSRITFIEFVQTAVPHKSEIFREIKRIKLTI